LIIGFGSHLRGDDGVGCRIARMLHDYYHDDPDVRVIGAHQLTPEMSEDIAGSEFVLFLDAAVGERPGEVRRSMVLPRLEPLSFTHSLDSASLLSAANELYGSAPQAELLTIVGASFEVGEELSDVVRGKLAGLVEKARSIVESHRHRLVAEAVL
jgi:hydrogenase maturation protease